MGFDMLSRALALLFSFARRPLTLRAACDLLTAYAWREHMRAVLLGSATLILLVWQTCVPSAQAARAGAGAAQAAIVKCRQMYSGDRGKAVDQAKGTFIESCFKQATGHYPFELGIPIYPPGYDWFTNPDHY
jgi:hypothetical protein